MNVSEFRRVFDNLPDGWLDLDEALLLVDWASKVGGPILEVGSYYGRSAVLLAHVTLAESAPLTNREVCCVDPWADAFSAPVPGDTVYTAFQENVKGLPVSWYRCRVEDWQRPVWDFPFCYLDGGHSYDETLAQIRKALEVGGKIIAVHDVNDSGGGLKIKRACLELLGPWTERVNRLAVWDKRST